MGTSNSRVAIVTGAGQGIGAAIAKGLAADGSTVVVNDIGASLTGGADDAVGEQSTVEAIEANGGTASLDTTDVADFDGVRSMVSRTIEQYGRLDIIVMSAGILRDRMIFNMTEDDWDAVIRVHLKGHFNLISAAATHWRTLNKPERHHRIVSITSGAGIFGAPGQPNYAAAKMGIIGLTHSSANALGKYGVTANSVAPAANTRMTAAYPSWPTERWESDEWSPDNVAPLVRWLASEKSAWCTGRVMGARGYEVVLYSNPVIQSSLRAENGWTVDALDNQIVEHFKPLIEQEPANPLPTVSSGR